MQHGEARTMMMYDAQKKSPVVAYLLWWFLGHFGAHRFYLGHVGSGIAMLCIMLISIPLCLIFIGFLGVFAIIIWWFIDAFLIPWMARRKNMQLAHRLGV